MLLFSPESDSKTIHTPRTCLWFFKLCYTMSLEGNTYEHRLLRGVGPWEIFLLSIFLYFLQFFVKSVYYFIIGKNEINKNKQISGCYGERIEWELHPLASALFQCHIISRVWQVAAGSPAQAVPDEHPGPPGCLQVTPDAKLRGLATSEFYQVLFCLFVCSFIISGCTHTHAHTHTREYAFWSVGFTMVGTPARSRFPGHLAWSPHREMVFGRCWNLFFSK